MVIFRDIGFAAMFMDLNHISTSAALQEWVLMIYPVSVKFLRYFVVYFLNKIFPYMIDIFAKHCCINSHACCIWWLFQGRMKEVNRNSKVLHLVRRVEMVHRRSIMYYQQLGSQPFLKLVVALPTMVTSCRGKNLDFICLQIFISS